jgi:hypothetical protein
LTIAPGKATARRLLALLYAFTHPYPIGEDDNDDDEQQRLGVLDTATVLCGIAEGAFSTTTG